MSTYSPADLRKTIDDIDDAIRASVVQGDVAEVFDRQRTNLVSFLSLQSLKVLTYF
jgi:hypothetical protein